MDVGFKGVSKGLGKKITSVEALEHSAAKIVSVDVCVCWFGLVLFLFLFFARRAVSGFS